MGQEILRIIELMLIFFVILFMAYGTTYILAKYKKRNMLKGNMEILETMDLGQGKMLSIVKTGNKYIVIGTTKTNINYITKIDEEELNLSKKEIANNDVFRNIMSKYLKNEKNGLSDEHKKNIK